MPSLWRSLAMLILSLVLSPMAEARTNDEMVASVCERAAEEAARRSGVPVSVLKAISLTETGRKAAGGFRPWPWTVNMEGAGHWFETLAEARAYVQRENARGAQSFDIGCFQINYRWHGEAFTSIDQMFEPLPNALYAARFLSELYAETGNWNDAAGAYHSRTKSFADKYAARFAQFRQRFMTEDTGGGPLSVTRTRLAADAPLSAIASLNFDTPSGSDIPEIPDIVAMLTPAGAQPRAPRENTYPLLLRQAEIRPPSGVAPRASLFTGMEPAEAPPTSDDAPAPQAGLSPAAAPPPASLFTGSGSAAGAAPGSLLRAAAPEGTE
ncbi:lytic transglycosylase domain-containing protein [Sinirhodobacter populi]|uniref:Lytic transglycosylase domain-containing protein n=1 Tax=Paenirhodobacter populi TaxID=2306993 RepID=A0A443KIM2_9RHOB|nr:lytic transglycosylase domain-containing protein [Sinirhodobacter populi]RWR32609.1 lytic transglycosylase domain-containing protein [Sinirhodobacter populi]